MTNNELQKIEHKSRNCFVDPFLIQQSTNELFVGDDGQSLLYTFGGSKTSYYILDALPVGTSLTMIMGSYGTILYLTSQFKLHEARKREEREHTLRLNEDKRREQIRKTREAAEVFNEALNIPFKWSVDHKVVISGLSENSWGCGTNRRTVMHVRVLEDFQDGRFKRKAGDFLCGKDDSVHQGYTDTSEGNKGVKVTCKQCLKVSKRFTR